VIGFGKSLVAVKVERMLHPEHKSLLAVQSGAGIKSQYSVLSVFCFRNYKKPEQKDLDQMY